jgi:hypothetical protein
MEFWPSGPAWMEFEILCGVIALSGMKLVAAA